MFHLPAVMQAPTTLGCFRSVNDLENALVDAAHRAARELYTQALKQCQDHWLEQRSDRFTAQRWRTLQWITPFGPTQISVRVVREKATGRYLTLSKVLFRGKATISRCIWASIIPAA